MVANNQFHSCLDSVIDQALNRYHVPGLALGVVSKNEVLIAKGYGAADVATSTPVTTQTIFSVGSCTKSITAYIIHRLVASQRIGWDDLVRDYLPNFSLATPNIANQITIRDLIAHRTGVFRHDAIWVLNPACMKNLIGTVRNLSSDYGLRNTYLYNNMMYGVAGLLIEAVTGQSWESLARSVLTEMGIEELSFNGNSVKSARKAAKPYAFLDGSITQVDYMDLVGILPAGALNTNVLGLLNWAGRQLTSHSECDINFIKESQTIHMPFEVPLTDQPYSRLDGYGLGWFIGKYRENKLVTHGGAVNGFNADVSMLPEQQLAVVALTNSSNTGRFAITEIRDFIFDNLLGLQTELNEQVLPPTSSSTEASPSSITNPHNFEGAYTNPAYGTVRIQAENGQLHINYGVMESTLTHQYGHRFTANVSQLRMYGAPEEVEVSFYMGDASDTRAQVHIGFEGFRGYPPIIFTNQ